ncbi:ABC transporter permease [Occallatibacter riparius]|uniref:ABC transporter permease n=1 Tax=Occallatibacter riparius TaxID=1002689 RepID=A0A9J7BTI3_9BACT|nr:ABC transporter permease [Occallatibacter riparius]UWZ85905.1 ABC transporter permease [Occallatibacter riparius]
MSALRRITNLFRRSRLDGEIAEELRVHVEMRIEDDLVRGMTPEEARREALVRFGNPAVMRERVAAEDANLGLESMARDVRYAARQLRRSPGFALSAMLVLALGIGAVTAIFSAVNPILFEPLPYPHGSRIVTVWDTYKGDRVEATYGTYRELAARSRAFDQLAAFEPWQPVMTGEQTPERLEGQSVSAGFFEVLGIRPALGRDFQLSDDTFRAPRVVIVTDRFWRQRLSGDAGVIGRTVRLDDDVYSVIGVMPRDFEDVLAAGADVFTPLAYDPAKLADVTSNAWGHHMRIAGRLREGVGLDEVRRDLGQIAANPQAEYPRPRWASLQAGLIVDSLQADVVRNVKPALLAVLGAVALLLAIACVNVTSLLLARGAMRQGEFAMRTALGASRGRLIRQSITETLLLAIAGGALGVAIAAAGIRMLVALSPPGLPRVDAIALNGPALLFAFLLTAAVGLAAGVMPALQAPRAKVKTALHHEGRTSTRNRQTARRVLVVSEVALALMLLVGAGLLLRSMQRLLAVEPGFNADHLLTLQVQTAGHKFDEAAAAPGQGDAARRRFFEQALEQVRKVPGVTQAGFTSVLPLSGDPYWMTVYGSVFENEDARSGHNVYRYAVSPGYAETMRMPLLRGRLLDERDTAKAPFAALISESLAKKEFPHGDALGTRLHVGPTNYPWFTVVGVVGDVRQASLALTDTDAVYVPETQTWFADDTLSFVIRTRGDAAALAPLVRNAIWSVDKDQPVLRVATMNTLLERSVAERRFVLILFEAFSLVALVLAATGIYGILANSVAERTREIGVRAALGASRGNLLALVMRQGLVLVLAGVALGLAGSLAATRALTSLLFGVSHLDPLTYAGVLVVLLCVAAAACLVPARRAAMLDPMQALRSE